MSAAEIEYATFVESRSARRRDLVVFDVKVELGQVRVYPIRRTERIAVAFDRADNLMPEVLALRADFPRVPHVNLRHEELPRSLCVYQQQYRDLKRSWTPARFVEDIRSWLSRTAKGRLHDEDQSLEPLLIEYDGHLILPADLLNRDERGLPERLIVEATRSEPGEYMLLARPPAKNEHLPADSKFILSVHCCDPQQHGIIRRAPRNLDELSKFVGPAGLDVLTVLRERLQRWKELSQQERGGEQGYLRTWLVLVIAFPKTRVPGGEEESIETWAFALPRSIQEIGIDIGQWTLIDGNLGIEPRPLADRTGKAIPIEILNPMFRPRRANLARMNGLATPIDTRIAAVGVGALGSQTRRAP